MSSRRPAAKGFTLLELLVVILLIGIIANFAVLSIGSRPLSDRCLNHVMLSDKDKQANTSLLMNFSQSLLLTCLENL